MKVVQINVTCGNGSTGNIALELSKEMTNRNIDNFIFYTQEEFNYPKGKVYMSLMEVKLQALKSKVVGNYGFQTKRATKRLINDLKKISPDIVHIHNIHGHNVNLDLLFSYFKEANIKLIWTFHDCWAFTGYCCHYDMINCSKWIKGCNNCPQRRKYSFLFDKSKKIYNRKKKVLNDLDLTIVTPSNWLKSQVEQSFMYNYDIRTIYNGVDFSVFKPLKEDIKLEYKIENKFIILGVAFDWGNRKGLDVFIELSKTLGDNYQIMLVGTNDKIDKELPSNIISIHRTKNQNELIKLYSAADLFVNPTREETLGLVNIEALSCGTPVITFNTGGSPECIDDSCGFVVKKNDLDELKKKIKYVYENSPFTKEACIKRAHDFNLQEMKNNYLRLYQQNCK